MLSEITLVFSTYNKLEKILTSGDMERQTDSRREERVEEKERKTGTDMFN